MSRLGSFSCFAIDTYAELSVVRKVLQGRFTPSSSTLLIEKRGDQLLPDRHRSTDLRVRDL